MLRREVVSEGCVSVWLGLWFESAGMRQGRLGKEEDVWERGNWERGVGCYCGVCLVGEGMRLSAFEEWCELVGTVVGSVARGRNVEGDQT
ncbi:hypothetical protein AAJP84_06000 [Bartonella schoenbuchensis]|uniref:hypothetical protein n=1 Tax=Bartonella schoenbuchensis TaxID=165694 RepID=UPI0031CC3C19